MMTRALLLAVALLAYFPLPTLAGPVVRFADGVEITLPDGYSYGFEDDRKTVVIYSKQEDLFQYRLTFHSLVEHLTQRPRITEEVVSSMAEKKGKSLHTIRGTTYKGFLEPGTRSKINGETARNMHSIVALREGYVTTTLTVLEKHANNPVVRKFVGDGMEALLATLKYVGN